MDLSDLAQKLQRLRKARGLSQEQLAEQIGVSRQAVSKWESAQAMPDVEKIVLLSEYFGVSTDYLLKAVETPQQPMSIAAVPEKEKPDAMSFTLAATALNLIGLVAALLLWELYGMRESVGTLAIAVGAVLMILGCAVYGVGLVLSAPATRLRAKRLFWAVNGGLLCYLPMVLLYNRITLGPEYYFVSYRYAPLPLGTWVSADSTIQLWPRQLFWVVYAAVAVGFAVFNLRKAKESEQSRP